jgi:hypothetical protein
MKKYFISQPMKGKTEEQVKEERAVLAAKIEAQGGSVLDSVFPDFTGEGRTPLLYLAKSIELLARADVAVFMPGWENARGCRIEHAACRDYGVPIELRLAGTTNFEEITKSPEELARFLSDITRRFDAEGRDSTKEFLAWLAKDAAEERHGET